MKKYLVTGSKGFIGKNLIKKLKDTNNHVRGIDKDFFIGNWKKILDNIIKKYDVVFHVGAISDTTLTDSSEMLTYNYTFSKVLFDIAQKYNVKVIYSSSAACYGRSDGVPTNIYGWSKLLAEDYGIAKCDEFVALRYFNVYGPGESHKGSMSSVAYQSLTTPTEELFSLFPGKPKRDFVYINDVVNANIHAIESPKGVYDVGSGDATTFETVLNNVGRRYAYYDRTAIPTWYQFFTKSEKSKWLPGWSPEYDVEKGIIDYKKRLNE